MVEKSLQPWERIAWSDDHLQVIYRECGNNLMRKQKLKIAVDYFEKSLELRDDDPKALYFLSMCQKYMALCEASYNSALRALSVLNMSQPCNFQVCNALYDLNEFETSGVELNRKGRLFTGHKTKAFKEKIDVVESNLMDSLGDALFQFIQEYKQYFKIIKAMRDKLENPDERPRWKILRDNKECDVMSILEEVEPLVHPRERARLYRGYKIFNHRYLQNSGIDVEFLKFLKTNKTLLLPQSTISPVLKHVAESNYSKVIRFLRMLQARNPLYNVRCESCPIKAKCSKEKQNNLFRLQYTTRRIMFIILKNVRRYRDQKERNMVELARYVEEVMGDYVILKTHRLIPWKFEFINEVYNTLALAYMDQVYIPVYVEAFQSSRDKLHIILQLPLPDERVAVSKFVFGDKSTWTEPEAIDYAYIRYNKLIQRLMKRIHFADYPIEKCYLCFEMARNHLEQNKFDDCATIAKKALGDADSCQNFVWKFLLTFLMFKSQVMQGKIERAKEYIMDLKKISIKLANETVTEFINLANQLLIDEIKLKTTTKEKSFYSVKKSRGESIQSLNR